MANFAKFWKIDLVIDLSTQVVGIYWSILENTAYDKSSGLICTITHNKISERNNKSFFPPFLLSTLSLARHSRPTPHSLSLIPLHPYTLPCDFETLVLTLSQSWQPSFRSQTLGGYDLVQITHSHSGYDLRSLLIQIAHSLHTRLVSHLHYLGFLFYFINLRFVLCFHCSVIWIWILNKFASRRLWEEKMICCFSHLFCCV